MMSDIVTQEEARLCQLEAWFALTGNVKKMPLRSKVQDDSNKSDFAWSCYPRAWRDMIVTQLQDTELV